MNRPLLTAVPNVSEARETTRLRAMTEAVENAGAMLLDVHSDAIHGRSVLTTAGLTDRLVAAMAELAVVASQVDLAQHRGVHPRLGGLDVCPFVGYALPTPDVVKAAHAAGQEIMRRAGLPVYFYGLAARRPEARELPDIRRGGLETLVERARSGFPPDLGGHEIDPRRGVVCVGARGPLIAFNVWLECEADTAREIARRVRESYGGLPRVRALGLQLASPRECQVAMNLLDPDVTGIEAAFERVERLAAEVGAIVTGTEIVGLPPEKWLPGPDARAARLLIAPGRSLESALKRR